MPIEPSPFPFIQRHPRALFLVLVLIGSARIVSTYHVFSHTSDEPVHIACGLEFLTGDSYSVDPTHPPLARAFEALGPYLAGVRLYTPPGVPRDIGYPQEVLYRGNRYAQTLTLARLGVLPFFWGACAVVYLWGKRHFGPVVAVLAVFLFSFLPPVLAHAGLATTDMACVASFGALLLAGSVLLEEPSPRHAAVFGVCGGLAILCKFSALVFFPACVAMAMVLVAAAQPSRIPRIVKAGRSLLPLLLLSAALAGLIVWAGYRFSLGPYLWSQNRVFLRARLPAPQLWDGLLELWRGNQVPGVSYALGHDSDHGFWYFFPLALAVKTPIAFLILAGAGVGLAARRPFQWRFGLPVACSAAILAVGMASSINVGVRHILPIYIGLSLLAAAAAARAWTGPRPAVWMRGATVLLLLWLTGASLLSHPDYLPYFNEIAARHPEKFLVDSDLDWGQDLKRLGLRLQALGARQVWFMYASAADFQRQPGFSGIDVQIAPEDPAEFAAPKPGWDAVSLTPATEDWPELHLQGKFWPDKFPPRERVGKSILLWYFPPKPSSQASP